ncbi:MAG TPA: hypothetical protein PKA64_20955 [Myxococcota bacterium]|nr:hypothetical protein [Myxococcota bacterium]
MRTLILLTSLAACEVEAPETPEDLPADALPPPLVLTASNPILGGKMTFGISGANANEAVYVLRTFNGTAARGQCFPQINNNCTQLVAPVAVHAALTADATGAADRTMNIPRVPAYDGTVACFQAVAVRGANGSQSVLSTPVCRAMGFDADDDGVIDAEDLCPGFDDFYDWDMDGTPDGCDQPADQAPVFTNATPDTPTGRWNRDTFQGRDVKWYIPANPTGLMFVFHGGGGDFEAADHPELVTILNELLRRGIGFAAFSSDARQPAEWDKSSRPAQNPDFQRLDAWRNARITAGDITANTPIFSWGFSNGGDFSSYMTNAALADNWPFRAAIVQSAQGYSSFYGDPADVPVMWIACTWDERVNNTDIENRYDRHVNAGRTGQFRLVPEQRLAPTRFDRSDLITLDQSLDMFKLVVNAGWFNKSGRRLFSNVDIAGTIEVIGTDPDFYPSKPGKGVLSSVLATHAINGYYYVQIGQFLDTYN